MASTIATFAKRTLALGSHTLIVPNKHNLGQHVLGYHIVGNPAGEPIFYFHGSPSSRLEAEDWAEPAAKLDICLVGIDRPGLGLSTFRPGYTLLDWPRDVQLLAKHLSFSTFRVIGGSGGGPYALACAREIDPSVLKGTGVLAGVAPPQAGVRGLGWGRWVGFTINKWLPAPILQSLIDGTMGRYARDPDQTQWRKIMTDGIIKTMRPEDQALLDDTARESIIAGIRDSAVSGAAGYVLDAKNILRRWPFELESVHGKVLLWNGTVDTDTPIDAARWMAARLPEAHLQEFEGESHNSIFITRAEEILKALLQT